jgi:hypothetical protein
MKAFRIHETLEYGFRLRGTAPHAVLRNSEVRPTFPFEKMKVSLSHHSSVCVSSSQFFNQFIDFHETWCEFYTITGHPNVVIINFPQPVITV